MNFKKISAGDPWPFSADMHNATVDAINDHIARKSTSQGSMDLSIGDTVRILNTANRTLERWSIVGIGDPTTLPEDSVEHFEQGRGFESIAPQAGEHFAILQDGIRQDTIGDAKIVGDTRCVIDLSDTTHKFAGPIDDDYDKLASQAAQGPARILFKNIPDSIQLNGAIDGVQTTITVDPNTDWPDPPFVITIGAEDLNVTTMSGAGNVTWTVTRGYNTTTPASHVDNSVATFKSGIVWSVVLLLPVSCDCDCPDVDAIAGQVDLRSFGNTVNWTSPPCDIIADIELIAPGGNAWAIGGVFGSSGIANGGGGYALKRGVTIPANSIVTFNGTNFYVGPGLTNLVAAASTAGAGTGGAGSLGDVLQNGGDGNGANPGGGGGSGGPIVNGENGGTPNGGRGYGDGGKGIRAYTYTTATFVVPSISSSVTIAVTDTSVLDDTRQTSIVGGKDGGFGMGPICLRGNITIIDATHIDFTLTEIIAGAATDVVAVGVHITQDVLEDANGKYPGGGAGSIIKGNLEQFDDGFLPLGGDGRCRISWGPGVSSVNGQKGAVEITDVEGFPLPASGGAVSLPITKPKGGGTGLDSSGFSAGSILEATGGGAFIEKKNNYAGAGTPTVSDDDSLGYSSGSIWIG